MPSDGGETKKMPVQAVAELDKAAFVELLGGIYEKSPWVAERTFDNKTEKTCESLTQLASEMKAVVAAATPEERLQLINSHPDLAGKAALQGDVTDDSREEQARAGLSSLSSEELARFNELNAQFKEKFGFVFILAVRHASKAMILAAFERRLRNDRGVELAECLAQIHKIAWMRLLEKFTWNLETGFLTCHVLDTAQGCPAAGMRVSLARVDHSGQKTTIANFVTNSDGRTGKALEGAAFSHGVYEWTFFTGEYFCNSGVESASTPFLDEVPIRFGIDNPEQHYHVPLLVSPWSFSTYRGS